MENEPSGVWSYEVLKSNRTNCVKAVAFKISGNFPFSRQKKEGDKTYEVIARKSLPVVGTAGKLGGQMFIQKLAQ